MPPPGKLNEILWSIAAALLFAAVVAWAACYPPLTAGAAEADLLDRDPCGGWERMPGCAERETAGDRWSADQLRAKLAEPSCEEKARNEGRMPGDECVEPEAPAPRDIAEDALRLVRPLDPIRILEVTEQGNLVIAGRAELLIIYCDDDKTAHIADLTQGGRVVDTESPLATQTGTRCSSTFFANHDRPVHAAAAGCRTFICFGDDSLRTRLFPEE